MLEHKLHNDEVNKEFVVLLHGIGGNSEVFYKQLNEYMESFNVLAINLPGHGNSPALTTYDSNFTFDLVSQEVINVLDYLNIKKAHFVGISLGSIVIHSLLFNSPNRVSSAVLGGALTHLNLKSKVVLAAGDLAKNVIPFRFFYGVFANILMPKNNHKKSREVFVREAKKMKREDFLGWYNIMKTLENTYEEMIKKAGDTPRLYISGEEDYLFVNELKKDINADKSAKLKVYKACGHACNIEKFEQFNKDSITFIESNIIRTEGA